MPPIEKKYEKTNGKQFINKNKVIYRNEGMKKKAL